MRCEAVFCFSDGRSHVHGHFEFPRRPGAVENRRDKPHLNWLQRHLVAQLATAGVHEVLNSLASCGVLLAADDLHLLRELVHELLVISHVLEEERILQGDNLIRSDPVHVFVY